MEVHGLWSCYRAAFGVREFLHRRQVAIEDGNSSNFPLLLLILINIEVQSSDFSFVLVESSIVRKHHL